MPWKTINGNSYYYRQWREGDRVVSEYIGNGPASIVAEKYDAVDRQISQEQRRRDQEQRQQHKALDNELDAYEAAVRSLVRSTLQANDYHQHKGQWRRRRDQ